MEFYELDAMFAFTVGMGLSAFVMAYAILCIALKAWAIKRESKSRLPPYQIPATAWKSHIKISTIYPRRFDTRTCLKKWKAREKKKKKKTSIYRNFQFYTPYSLFCLIYFLRPGVGMLTFDNRHDTMYTLLAGVCYLIFDVMWCDVMWCVSWRVMRW